MCGKAEQCPQGFGESFISAHQAEPQQDLDIAVPVIANPDGYMEEGYSEDPLMAAVRMIEGNN